MSLPGWPHDEPPFHPGEREVQTRAGSRERMAQIGPRAIRASMPAQHREFFPLPPFVALGAVDATGQPWATLLTGPRPGFIRSPTETLLRIDALPPDDDPVAPLLHAGADLGLLGIELQTRRRNRANGRVTEHDENGFTLHVQQSFGNCPKYIQRRELLARMETGSPAAPRRLTRLDAATTAIVRSADTFFVATHAAAELRSGGSDVSHRGGRPGFVRVYDNGSTITWPDFSGNRFFNTLGNMTLDARSGLVFADFTNGDLLHAAGLAEIVWEADELREFQGAERLVRLQVHEVILRRDAWPLRWQLIENSPSLQGTGTW